MDVDKCAKCQANLNIDDPLRTPIEFPCDHEICAKCIISVENEENTKDMIQCLMCNEKFKMKKSYKAILNMAKKSAEVMTCEKHPLEQLVYICSFDRKLLCIKCILEPFYADKMSSIK